MAIVHVSHPVPVRHLPPRCRVEQVDFVRRSTPVELVEREAGDFEPLDVRLPGERRAFFAHGGRLWTRLTQDQPGGAPRPLRRAELLAFLDGKEPFPGSDLLDAFRRTPLLGVPARRDARGNALAPHPLQGREAAELAGTRILEDLHEPAVAALRSFLVREVAVVGDEVFARVHGPLAFHDKPPRGGHEEVASFHVRVFPRALHWNHDVVHPDRVRDVMPLLDGAAGGPGSPFILWWGAEEAASLPRDLMGDEDILLYANVLPELVTWTYDLFARSKSYPRAAAMREMFDGRIAPLRSLAALGRIGAIGEDDMERTILQFKGFLSEFNAAFPKVGGMLREAKHIALFVEPRLREAARGPIPEEDIDALAGLGPGGP